MTMQMPAGNQVLSEDRLLRRLEMLITELQLDRRDFVIFGSGPLLAHGLRRRIHDLDIVARGDTWQKVREYGVAESGTVNGAPIAQFWDGHIQFSAGWVSARWNAGQLIDRAEVIQGLPFARLADVLAYKQELRRPKDRPDIAVLLHELHQTGLRALPGCRYTIEVAWPAQ
jgi:hypothetical protein